MIYTNQAKYNLLFTCSIITFFLIDLGQFFLVGTVIIPFVLCIYCTLLLYTPRNYLSHTPSYKNHVKYDSIIKNNFRHLFIIALVQCLEFFCFYNFFSLALLFLIPAAGLAFVVKKNLYPSITNLITLTFISIIIHIYAVEAYLLPISPSNTYTIIRIGVILLVVISFSLIINVWGMQDNRA